MKILHTADWHIGKKLHKHDLNLDFEKFVEWLVQLVQSEKIEVLLISGDVFDLANPSSEARSAYYKALVHLSRLRCQIIITGGNHDSPAVLNAPRELLQSLNIHIVGNLTPEIAETLIPLKNKEGKVEMVVAAIPYLRAPDLRSPDEEIGYENRVEATRQGIARIFKEAADSCRKVFPEIPAIAMGHLFAAGVSTSESEREIQIGNEASFEASGFDSHFRYIALGHIHRPQQVKASMPVFYSGSPLPLSFSEREDKKRVLVLDTEKMNVRSIEIPVFRELKRISGTLDQLETKLRSVEKKGDLSTLVEIELIEDQYDPAKLLELDRIVQEFKKEGVEIVKHRATFKSRVKGASELFQPHQHLEDLQPQDVFHQLLEQHHLDEETTTLLQSAFREILEQVQNPAES